MTTIASGNYYTIEDIDNIIYSGIQYKLSQDTLDVISMLSQEFQNIDTTTDNAGSNKRAHPSGGHTAYDDDNKRTTHANSSSNRRGDKPGRFPNGNKVTSKSSSNEDWESLRTFKTTQIEKKEGLDKRINDVRVMLNKISVKNYTTQKEAIITHVKEIIQVLQDQEDMPGIDDEDMVIVNGTETMKIERAKLAKNIYDIVGTNKFFSELYADLYKELIAEIPYFSEYMYERLDDFKKTIDAVHYVDSNVDYDGFCAYTKTNDIRKAVSTFIINMSKKGVIPVEYVLDILLYLLDRSIQYIDEENRTNELEEITENLYIFVSQCQTLFTDSPKWKDVCVPHIISISQMKTKDHKSLTNRVVFKYMDIIDTMEE